MGQSSSHIRLSLWGLAYKSQWVQYIVVRFSLPLLRTKKLYLHINELRASMVFCIAKHSFTTSTYWRENLSATWLMISAQKVECVPALSVSKVWLQKKKCQTYAYNSASVEYLFSWSDQSIFLAFLKCFGREQNYKRLTKLSPLALCQTN